jgi:hypothetical protein
MIRKRTLSHWLAALRSPGRAAAPSNELHTVLFHSTFRIQGPNKDDLSQTSFGTGLIMGMPKENTDAVGFPVLATASHVLEDIGGDLMSLLVRRPGSEGSYTAYPYDIQIRDHGRPLYVKHRDADIAAMYVNLPADVPITGLAPDFLADDQRLRDIELHPGDEIFCLGFPLAAAAPGAFPILRTGHIASYPLTPMTKVKQIRLDVALLPGSSGGPAYYSYAYRIYDGKIRWGLKQGLLGLVIQADRCGSPEFGDKYLDFSVILPAPFIRETIDALPKSRTAPSRDARQ